MLLRLNNCKGTRVSMELSNQLVSWFITYLRDLLPTYIWNLIHLLSTMDFPVGEDWGILPPKKSDYVKGTPGISEIWFGSNPPPCWTKWMKYFFFILWGQFRPIRSPSGTPLANRGYKYVVYPKYDHLSLMLFLYYLELIVSWTVKLLEVCETAFVIHSCETQNNLCFTGAVWTVFGRHNLFGQVYWPCSENLEHSYYVFSHLQLLCRTWVGPLPRTVTTRTTFFLEGGPKLNLQLATDILGEEGKSNI